MSIADSLTDLVSYKHDGKQRDVISDPLCPNRSLWSPMALVILDLTHRVGLVGRSDRKDGIMCNYKIAQLSCANVTLESSIEVFTVSNSFQYERPKEVRVRHFDFRRYSLSTGVNQR